MTPANLSTENGIPAELASFVSDGFIVPVSFTPDEKTVTFDIPSLAYEDEKDNDFDFSLIWIHPEFNQKFCHFYDETPGDLPNFYLMKETRNARDEQIEIDSLD